MEASVRFLTDTATFALFDPRGLVHRVEAVCDWWCFDLLRLPEIQGGSAVIVGLDGDGIYRARITTGDLTSGERDYASESIPGLGVEVVSGELFAGPAECLPGGDIAFTPAEARHGLILALNDGPYDVDLYAIRWADSPRWWREDQTVPDDAPADIVVILRPRLRPYPGLNSEPRFHGLSGVYLFESMTRQIGPRPGMILTTKVRKGPTNELSLKNCGPGNYRASLTDFDDVDWKDTIRLKVLTVDHPARRLIGEFVARIEGP